MKCSMPDKDEEWFNAITSESVRKSMGLILSNYRKIHPGGMNYFKNQMVH